MEQSASNTDRNNHDQSVIQVAEGAKVNLASNKISKLFKQRSISDNSSMFAEGSQAVGVKTFLKSKRASSTLRDALSKIGSDKLAAASLPMSPSKQSPMMTHRPLKDDKVKLGKFNLMSLTKKNSNVNIFQLPVAAKKVSENLSPLQTDRHPSITKVAVSPHNTYYLRTQNKNPINARATAGKFFKKSESSENSGTGMFNRQSSQGQIKTKTSSFREGGGIKSTEKSIGFRPNVTQTEKMGDTLRERKLRVAANPKNTSKLTLESFTKQAHREDSPSQRESNYLLPVSHTKQAFKKARGRPLKNSLLRNVFNS